MKFNTLLATAAATLMVFSLIPTVPAAANVDIYITPGNHVSGGREWSTTCETYSSNIDRCTTKIKASQIKMVNGKYQSVTGWVFNNLTYKPVPRHQWGSNPLANEGSWTATDGRKWRTECDSAATGQNGCRSHSMTSVIQLVGGKYVKRNQWVFNNMVRFTAATTTPVNPTPAPPKSAPMPSIQGDCSLAYPSSGQTYYTAPGVELCIFNFINADRVAIGLAPLVRDTRIDAVARDWSLNLAKKVDFKDTQLYHNPDHAALIRAALGGQERYITENAGMSSWGDGGDVGTPVHTWLMNSPGHHANMMDPNMKFVGVGAICRTTDHKCFVTENFASDPV